MKNNKKGWYIFVIILMLAFTFAVKDYGFVPLASIWGTFLFGFVTGFVHSSK